MNVTCRRCWGSGEVENWEEETVPCPVCQGAGELPPWLAETSGWFEDASENENPFDVWSEE